jgi:hypothetical protein
MSHLSSHFTPRRAMATLAVSSLGALLAMAGGLLAAGSAQASTLPTLTLAVTKTSITVGGATQSGAVNVVATATGVKEGSAILFLLKPGVSVAELESVLKAAGKDPNNASKYGTIVFDEEASAGKTEEAQTYLQPGSYVALGATLHGDRFGLPRRAAHGAGHPSLDRVRLPRAEHAARRRARAL